MHIELDVGKPNRYETPEQSEARASTLLRVTGIWTGVRRRRDGTFSLLYDPWAREHGPVEQNGVQDDTADSNLQLHRLPPGDGDAGADLPLGAAVGQAAE